METGKVFKTKTGYCHILPDKIVFTRDGVIGNLASTIHGNHVSQSIVIYVVIMAVLAYFLVTDYWKDDLLAIGLNCAIMTALFYYIIKAFGYSATAVIKRRSIRQVVFRKAIPFLTRASFQVLFIDEKGRARKRLIFLPGSLNDQTAANEAFELMRSEHLITD